MDCHLFSFQLITDKITKKYAERENVNRLFCKQTRPAILKSPIDKWNQQIKLEIRDVNKLFGI